MAGRGRGRGVASFNISVLGFNRGDALPQPIHQPPPLYPPLEFKAVPLLQGEEYDYMLALKQEFRGTIRESPFFLKVTEKKKDIHRYSDKYQFGSNDGNSSFTPDWDRLPSELKTVKKKVKKVRFTPKPNVPSKAEAAEVLKTLETLEKKDVNSEEAEAEENEGEENELEEYYEEEDEEEDNDYNLNYFDNGEDYGDDDDDDADEGPTY
ncbi:DNA-directed RNA polymerase III subunit RPC7-like [Argonauta hians]